MGWQDAPEAAVEGWKVAPSARQVTMPDGKAIWELDPGEPGEDAPKSEVVAATTGLANGITAGLTDRMASGLGAVIPNPAGTSIWQGPNGMRSLGDAYDLSRQQVRGYAAESREDNPNINLLAEATGSIASPLGRLIPGGGLARTLANEAAYGGIYGAATSDSPVEGGLTGAASSLASGALMRGAGKLASPIVNPAVARLRQAGIPLTLGQMAGGVVKRMEDAATSIPGLGDLIRHNQRRGLDALQRGGINEALAPIGQTLPKDIPTGRDAVNWAQNAAGQAYDDALIPLHVTPDADFATGVTDVNAGVAGLTDDQIKIYESLVKRHVTPYVGPSIDGHQLQDIKQGLDQSISRYGKGAPADQDIADSLGGLRDEFMSLADRGAPEQAAAFRAANAAYRNMVPINKASAKNLADGTFTANQLSMAVREADRSRNKMAFARGDAPMQSLADAASKILPSSVPDSGTWTRGLLTTGALGGGSTLLGNPTPLIAGGILSAPYLPGGREATEWLFTGRQNPVAKKVRGMFGRLAAPAASVAPILALGE